ncbi:hypothetical protein ACHWQZ_G012088 [Mnemiopsis leidyi]
MLAGTLVLLQYLIPLVHGWIEVQRGAAQLFDFDREALQLEIIVPVNTQGVVDLWFADQRSPFDSGIGWNIPEYRFTVTDCGEIDIPVDPLVSTDNGYQSHVFSTDNGYQYHVTEDKYHVYTYQYHVNGDQYHDDGYQYHDDGYQFHDDGYQFDDNGYQYDGYQYDDYRVPYTSKPEPPTRLRYRSEPRPQGKARTSFPVMWAIVKSSYKLEIFAEGKPIYTMLKSEANPLCRNRWWSKDNHFTFITVSMDDNATVRYRILKESMCPPSHPYVYDSGYHCCTKYTGGICDDEMSRFVPCCPTGKSLECKEPPCNDYVYSDVMGIQGKLSDLQECVHGKYDYYGSMYRGKITHSASMVPCINWHLTPAITHTDFDDDMGLTLTRECRNPDLDEKGPWCYITATSNGDLIKEACDVAYCDGSTEEEFEESLREPLQGTEQPGEEEFEVVLLRLSQPTMLSQQTLGYHGPEDAIDGDFDTFALHTPGFGSWEAAISCDENREYSVTRVVVYTHSAFLFASGMDDYNLMITLEALDQLGTGTMGLVCEAVSGDDVSLDERKEFKCEKRFLSPRKVFVSLLFQENRSMAIREVEVYGQLAPTGETPEPKLMVDRSDSLLLIDPYFESKGHTDEQKEDQETEETTQKPSLEELKAGKFKLRFEMDWKNKKINRMYLTENTNTIDKWENPHLRFGDL